MATALVDPQARPPGSFAQPSTVWYGFGRSLMGLVVLWPPAEDAASPRITTARPACTMWRLSAVGRQAYNQPIGQRPGQGRSVQESVRFRKWPPGLRRRV